MLYRFRMSVLEEQSYLYEVEAENIEEASLKAIAGETESEELIDFIGITNREIMENETQ